MTDQEYLGTLDYDANKPEEQTAGDPDWIKEADDLGEDKGDYKVSVYLSTDGKHTVNVESDPKNAKEAIYKAVKLYDYLKNRYGTKQAQAVKEYAAGNGKAPKMCGIHGTEMSWKEGISKAGKPYAFWSCPTKNADGSWCNFKPKD